MINYEIYVDGSCRATKVGGIGIIWLKNGEKVFEYSNRYENTTNNQMELLAIYIALKSIKKSIDSLTIISDSEYALGCVFNETWKPKKNLKLINSIKKELMRVKQLTTVSYKHVYGHQTNLWNNYVDKMAQKESNYD